MKNCLYLILLFLTLKLSSQCAYTVTASYTPATCPSCCNGAITPSLSGSGVACTPITWNLSPPGTMSPGGIWYNLCPGSYTLTYINGGCCTFTCNVIINFSSTSIIQNKEIDYYLFYNSTDNTIMVNIKSNNSFIKVYDLTGKNINEKHLNFGINSLELNNLNGGLYTAILFVENRPIKQLKILKE